MSDETEQSKGHARLVEILSQAVASSADAIEMERDSGGSLEVSFMSGNAGVGFALDREDGYELIDALANEKKKSRGRPFRVTINGVDYMVGVQTYDHFGEHAYRLTIRAAKR